VIGRITRLIRGRACGFIRVSAGQDVFFHASDVEGAGFNELEDRVIVRFTLISDAISGPRAVRVRVDREV